MSDDHPTVVVKPGTLDDTTGLVARAHLWVRHAQPWTAPLRAGAASFDEQPEDFGQLVKEWSKVAEHPTEGQLPPQRTSEDRA